MWNRGCISGQRAPLKQVQTAFNYLSTGGVSPFQNRTHRTFLKCLQMPQHLNPHEGGFCPGLLKLHIPLELQTLGQSGHQYWKYAQDHQAGTGVAQSQSLGPL